MPRPLSPTRGALRALRGGLLAASSGTLAVAAHTVAGGRAPDTGLAVVLVLLLAGAGTALADRRRGAVAIIAALGGSQLALHLLLAALSTHTHAAGPTVDPVAMTSAHTLAALATGGLLAGAESAVFALVSALALLLPSRLSPPPADAPLRLALPTEPIDLPLLAVLFGRVLTRRGPPVRA